MNFKIKSLDHFLPSFLSSKMIISRLEILVHLLRVLAGVNTLESLIKKFKTLLHNAVKFHEYTCTMYIHDQNDIEFQEGLPKLYS